MMRRGLTNVSLQCFCQHGKAGTFVYAAPYHQRESTFGTTNSTHFAQGRCPIGEELQAQLAIHDVEGAVWEWQLVSTSFLPLE